MTNKFMRLLSLFLLYASLSTPAHAYLDPATGSIILQAVIGAVGTAILYYKIGMAKTRAALGRLFGRKDEVEDK